MEEIIDYDEEDDILYYNKGHKAQDSLRINDFIVDFDSNNRIVGLEILNASENIEMLTGEKPDNDELNQIIEAEISVKRNNKMAVITFLFLSEKAGEKKAMRIPIDADSGMMA